MCRYTEYKKLHQDIKKSLSDINRIKKTDQKRLACIFKMF